MHCCPPGPRANPEGSNLVLFPIEIPEAKENRVVCSFPAKYEEWHEWRIVTESKRDNVQGSTSKTKEISKQMVHGYGSVKSGLPTSHLNINSKS